MASYQRERENFIARMTQEGLPLAITRALLRAATTINRNAELACSSEAADRDRVDCPASPVYTVHPIKRLIGKPRKVTGPCLCDVAHVGDTHETITRITLQDYRIVCRLQLAIPADWGLITEGDPRGYTLKVVPPSYAERNRGRDRWNLEAIGVPPGPSRIRW